MSSPSLKINTLLSFSLSWNSSTKFSQISYIFMASSADTSRALPKFGEWDVNDPASAEGYTVIFNKARDEKKSGNAASGGNVKTHKKYEKLKESDSFNYSRKKKFLGCF